MKWMAWVRVSSMSSGVDGRHLPESRWWVVCVICRMLVFLGAEGADRGSVKAGRLKRLRPQEETRTGIRDLRAFRGGADGVAVRGFEYACVVRARSIARAATSEGCGGRTKKACRISVSIQVRKRGRRFVAPVTWNPRQQSERAVRKGSITANRRSDTDFGQEDGRKSAGGGGGKPTEVDGSRRGSPPRGEAPSNANYPWIGASDVVQHRRHQGALTRVRPERKR